MARSTREETRDEFERRPELALAAGLFDPVASIKAMWVQKDDKEAERKQERWKEFCHTTTMQAVRLIEANPAITLDELLNFLSEKRKAIGRELRHAETYGRRRLNHEKLMSEFIAVRTPAHGGEALPSPYLSQSPYIIASINRMLGMNHPDISAYIYNDPRDAVVKDVAIYGNGIDKNGHPIKLIYSRLMHVIKEGKETVITAHMLGQDQEAALRYVKSIFDTIKTCRDEYTLLTTTFLFLWHMTGIMPYENGAASITLMLYSISLQLPHIIPARVEGEISPDFLAFAHLPSEYVIECLKRTNHPAYAERYKKEHEDKSLELKVASEPRYVTPLENERQITCKILGQDYPLSLHNSTPFSCRLPIRWRSDHSILIINLCGIEGFQKNMQRRKAKNLAELHETLGEGYRGFLELLEENDNVYWGAYYQHKREVRFHISTKIFDDWILYQSTAKLEEQGETYERSQRIFFQLERMPYIVRNCCTFAIPPDTSPRGFDILSKDDALWMEAILTNLPALEGAEACLAQPSPLVKLLSETIYDKNYLTYLQPPTPPSTIPLLELAILQQQPRLISILLSKPGYMDRYEPTRLVLLAMLQSEDIAVSLVNKFGTDAIESIEGMSPLMAAIYLNKTVLFEKWVSSMPHLLDLPLASHYKHPELKSGTTPLALAKGKKNLAMVQLLLDKGANPDLICHEKEAKLCLHAKQLAIPIRLAREIAKDKFNAMTPEEQKEYHSAHEKLNKLTQNLFDVVLQQYTRTNASRRDIMSNIFNTVTSAYKAFAEAKTPQDAHAISERFLHEIEAIKNSPSATEIKYGSFFSSISIRTLLEKVFEAPRISQHQSAIGAKRPEDKV